MANAFKTFTDTAVGTGNADVYTCPSATETTIIGLNIANILDRLYHSQCPAYQQRRRQRPHC